MYSPLNVWCVQAVVVSGCDVEGYSSVMRCMTVVVVCARWCWEEGWLQQWLSRSVGKVQLTVTAQLI